MAADVNAIVIGMTGRWAMLEAVFGSSEQSNGHIISESEMSPELYDAVFG